MTLSSYEDRKARAIAPAAPKRPLTDSERRARNYDWRTYTVKVGKQGRLRWTGLRGLVIVALPQTTHPDDITYRAGLRLRKGEKIKEVNPV